jgi:hypothetical protein
MLDYTAHMSSIQAKYFNRDKEEKSGAKMRCGVQVGGAPGVHSRRHRRKNTVCFTYPFVPAGEAQHHEDTGEAPAS